MGGWWTTRTNREGLQVPLRFLYMLLDMKNGWPAKELLSWNPWYFLPCCPDARMFDARARKYVFRNQAIYEKDKRFLLSWCKTLDGVKQRLESNYDVIADPKIVMVSLDEMYDRGLYHKYSHVDLSSTAKFNEYYSRGEAGQFDIPKKGFRPSININSVKERSAQWEEVLWGTTGTWWMKYAVAVDELGAKLDDKTVFEGMALGSQAQFFKSTVHEPSQLATPPFAANCHANCRAKPAPTSSVIAEFVEPSLNQGNAYRSPTCLHRQCPVSYTHLTLPTKRIV